MVIDLEPVSQGQLVSTESISLVGCTFVVNLAWIYGSSRELSCSMMQIYMSYHPALSNHMDNVPPALFPTFNGSNNLEDGGQCQSLSIGSLNLI